MAKSKKKKKKNKSKKRSEIIDSAVDGGIAGIITSGLVDVGLEAATELLVFSAGGAVTGGVLGAVGLGKIATNISRIAYAANVVK